MRAAVILAMIPLGIAATFLPRWPDPQPAVAETFVQRFEAVYPKHTFEQRWWPGEGLPLPQASLQNDLLAPKVIRTIRITKADVEPPQEVSAVAEVVPLPEPRPKGANPSAGIGGSPPKFKPRPTRVADICQRHGMHRVDYGKTWRCRR
jgi:hypothetical protein